MQMMLGRSVCVCVCVFVCLCVNTRNTCIWKVNEEMKNEYIYNTLKKTKKKKKKK